MKRMKFLFSPTPSSSKNYFDIPDKPKYVREGKENFTAEIHEGRKASSDLYCLITILPHLQEENKNSSYTLPFSRSKAKQRNDKQNVFKLNLTLGGLYRGIIVVSWHA